MCAMIYLQACIGICLSIWAYAGNALFLPLNETSTFLPVLPTIPQAQSILCFNSSQQTKHTTVEGCRSTLNHLRNLPAYRIKQPFQHEKYPKIPFNTEEGSIILTPPFRFHAAGSDCALQISTHITEAIDVFSFYDVRQVGQSILEDCQSEGGYGGVGVLGNRKGWEVQIVGFTKTMELSQNRTIFVEGYDGREQRIVFESREPANRSSE